MKLSKADMINYAAILVIVVSLSSIGMELTGFATVTDTAIVNVTIQSSAAINFTTSFVDFANGTVNGTSGAELTTEGSVTDGTWAPISTGFVLENIGNVNVSLGFYADKVAADYIGGTNPSFQYKVVDTNEPTSCEGPTAASWTDFLTTNVTACTNFPFDDTTDELELEIRLYIPSDATAGERTATIATGEYA